MADHGELYDQVTRLRSEAFELIARLEAAGGETSATACVVMQGVANALGRAQGVLAGRTESVSQAASQAAFSDVAKASAIR